MRRRAGRSDCARFLGRSGEESRRLRGRGAPAGARRTSSPPAISAGLIAGSDPCRWSPAPRRARRPSAPGGARPLGATGALVPPRPCAALCAYLLLPAKFPPRSWPLIAAAASALMPPTARPGSRCRGPGRAAPIRRIGLRLRRLNGPRTPRWTVGAPGAGTPARERPLMESSRCCARPADGRQAYALRAASPLCRRWRPRACNRYSTARQPRVDRPDARRRRARTIPPLLDQGRFRRGEAVEPMR
jgi:hypothetical protein